MRCRAARVRTACRVVWCVSLASSVVFFGHGASSSSPLAADRYDTAIFVCRSVDPTPTPLNIREKPFGRILGRLSPQSLLYVRGRDLKQPVRGYVPIRFYLEVTSADLERTTTPSLPSAPAGWVWKNYITCELLS
ncbi:MAG: hypothetical protein RLZZ117_1056 [Cyanobacteriota bacterium]